MIIFNKEAMGYCVIVNNLNPIELIAVGGMYKPWCGNQKKASWKSQCGPICLHLHQKRVLNEALAQKKPYLEWA